jgi:hypothetical protein
MSRRVGGDGGEISKFSRDDWDCVRTIIGCDGVGECTGGGEGEGEAGEGEGGEGESERRKSGECTGEKPYLLCGESDT